MDRPLWQPSSERIARANLTAFVRDAHRQWGEDIRDYPGLYRWSVTEPERFWQSVWSFCKVIGDRGSGPVLIDGGKMPGAQWFPQARLNFAENLLRRRDHATALVFWGENRVRSRVTYGELHAEVSRLAQALRSAGVGPGDRVAGYMPNVPGTVIAMLSAASIGATWSSCSPDFGVQGVLDRFGQIEPKVLFAADGYFYNEKTIDVLERLKEIAANLPSLQKVAVVPYARRDPVIGAIRGSINVHEWMAPYRPRPIKFEPLPFNHPLYILYSSGTTGVPKCIVHGAGGTLLQHIKEHQLHVDLKSGDRLFYFTTCSWMMWNWLVSGLASGATLLLYDGSPLIEGGRILFDLAEREAMTVFGTSAKYIDGVAKLGLKPRETHRLDSVRALLSTGSPLLPESFDFVYRDIKEDIHLASMSGGTSQPRSSARQSTAWMRASTRSPSSRSCRRSAGEASTKKPSRV